MKRPTPKWHLKRHGQIWYAYPDRVAASLGPSWAKYVATSPGPLVDKIMALPVNARLRP